MTTNKNKVVDVLIIGDGIAGCTAALAAHKQRADVMIIEKSQPNLPHGNTAFCGGALRRVSRDYPETRYFADIMKVSQGEADKVLTRITIRNSRRAKAGLRRWVFAGRCRPRIRGERIALLAEAQRWLPRFGKRSRKPKYQFCTEPEFWMSRSPTIQSRA